MVTFPRLFGTIVGVLVVLCAVFVFLTSSQGPRLSEVSISSRQVVELPNQQLRFFANQPIAQVDEEQVTITPEADFSVATDGDIISVQFDERLRYGAEYTVTIDGVTNTFTDTATTFEHRFDTVDAELYYLDRADPAVGGDDVIMTSGIRGGSRSVVYSAPGIQDFEVVGGLLVVVSLEEDRTSSMQLVSIDDLTVENIVLPVRGTIDRLDVAGDTGLMGFTLTSAIDAPEPRVNQLLYWMDLTGSHTVEPVLGIDGQPIEVMEWFFLPDGSTTAVVHGDDLALSLIDPASDTPGIPLGQYDGVESASPDGTTLVVSDIYSRLTLSLADGTEERIIAAPVEGQAPAGGDVQLLGEGAERIQQVAVLDEETGRFQSYIVADDGDAARVLYTSDDGRASIYGFAVSPNSQYLSVEITPDAASSVSDGYAMDPVTTTVTTVVIDIESGQVVSSFDGFSLVW
ncbi:hypothetical protein [Marisediminicola senii]|uniref:hypothetical protein n=1 Tax=Marisediminicola senii TaxID=2711233 RepID=UPI0013EBDA32|nr:hypothetical protein [Marisediminicola senii]